MWNEARMPAAADNVLILDVGSYEFSDFVRKLMAEKGYVEGKHYVKY
jgi:hypothetical protein